jgi:hypothetical protein
MNEIKNRRRAPMRLKPAAKPWFYAKGLRIEHSIRFSAPNFSAPNSAATAKAFCRAILVDPATPTRDIGRFPMAEEVQETPKPGLQIGIVKKLGPDPANDFRVFVSLPPLHDDATGVWARVATWYASDRAGAVFYPELGDEVVVGFAAADAVILGSVYGRPRPPPIAIDNKNTRKSLVTRSGLQINFDEDHRRIEIITPDRRTIAVDDTSAEIVLKDSSGSAITLSKNGIALKDSMSNAVTMSKDGISLKSAGNITVSATGEISLSAYKITMSALTSFSAKGASDATVTSNAGLNLTSAHLNLKSGAVMIQGQNLNLNGPTVTILGENTTINGKSY